MSNNDFTSVHRSIGRTTAWTVFLLLMLYIAATIAGFLSLESPEDPIGDPFFTIMEILIILIAPLMVVNMVAVHAYASSEVKVYGFIALIFMIIMAVITSSVHFVILTVSQQIEIKGLSEAALFFSFNWPSVAYTLDILAWDWFFALSMLFAAIVFSRGRLEIMLRTLMIVSGILSLVGILGVPLANMQVRNIGIIGYAAVSLFIFPLLGIIFGRVRPELADTKSTRNLQKGPNKAI